MSLEYYNSKLFQDYNPNPVFAEISTGNWVYALAKTIELTHGQTTTQWKTSLNNSFNRIQNVQDFPLIHLSMRALSQGMSLTLSLQARRGDFEPWHTIGLISDFYYSMTNIFDVIIMAQANTTYEDHTTRINLFDGLRAHLPHPFDMISSFDEPAWRDGLLVTKDHFKFSFPNLGFETNSASEGLINNWHNGIDAELSRDILLGYLRGTTGYVWELKCDNYKESHRISSLRAKIHKDEINLNLKKMRINFLNCLYRYRTKAHYRDFIYLTWNRHEASINKRNIYIDEKFINSLFLISNFTVCVAIRYLIAKIGRDNTRNMLNALNGNLKNHNNLWADFL